MRARPAREQPLERARPAPGTPPAHPPAAARPTRRGSAPRPRSRSSASRPRCRRDGAPVAARVARATARRPRRRPRTRAATSSVDRSPSRRSRSWTWSRVVARRSSASAWSASSRSASAAGSSSSRSSSWPSSSRSRSRSSVSACGAAFGQRRVALVHVRGDVVEEQRRGERRRARRLDRRGPRSRAARCRQELAQRRQVEHVRQALAVRLDAGSGTSRSGSPPPADRRRAGAAARAAFAAGPTARQEQRPRGVLAEARREQRRIRTGATTRSSISSGSGRAAPRCRRGRVAFGQPDGDPVVGPDGLDLGAESLAQSRLERQRPRRVDACPERREQADPPVAELVAEPLDDDPPVGRAGRPSPRARPRGRRPGSPRRGRRGRAARRAALGRPPAAVALAPGRPRSRGRSRPARVRARSGGPTVSPCQNGSLPGTPGAGVTRTRSGPISSMRHDWPRA